MNGLAVPKIFFRIVAIDATTLSAVVPSRPELDGIHLPGHHATFKMDGSAAWVLFVCAAVFAIAIDNDVFVIDIFLVQSKPSCVNLFGATSSFLVAGVALAGLIMVVRVSIAMLKMEWSNANFKI